MTKINFSLRNVAMIACLAVSVMFASCDKEDDPKDPGGEKTGWPPAAKLAEYNLGEWKQPAGIGGIMWVETQNGNPQVGSYYTLGITFTSATAATRKSMNDFLEPWASPNISWTADGPEVFEVVYVKYTDDYQYSVYATFNTQNGGMGSFSLRRAPYDGGADDFVNPFEDEYSATNFPALTGGSNFVGTWQGNGYSLQLDNSGAWTLKMQIGATATTVGSGRFLVSDNTAYFYWQETEDGAPYYYFNGYGIRNGNTLIMSGGMTSGGETWTKQ
jgi:hypothetical protein